MKNNRYDYYMKFEKKESIGTYVVGYSLLILVSGMVAYSIYMMI